jgi:hypothetical protein
MTNKEFYIPDEKFWLFGFAGVVVLFFILAVLRMMLKGFKKCVKYMLCDLCCTCRCTCMEDPEQADIVKRRERTKKHGASLGYSKVAEDDDEDDDQALFDDVEMGEFASIPKNKKKHKKKSKDRD